jgi:antitoxin (DNA-binding transcriptional repressor) of toxin-antitoxin stability system
MTFITARDLRLNPSAVWSKLKKDDSVVVTLNGRPVAVISGVTPDALEEYLLLFKRLKAQMAVSKLRQASVKSGLSKTPAREIEREIKASRAGRSK